MTLGTGRSLVQDLGKVVAITVRHPQNRVYQMENSLSFDDPVK